MLYLDNNATTRLDPEVKAAMDAALALPLGNPSSLHGAGQAARRLIDAARKKVATLIGARVDEIVFCSSGTAAANIAIFGSNLESSDTRRLLTSAVEHQAVLEPCRQLARLGHEVCFLGVDAQGRLDLEAARAAVASAGSEAPTLVSLMLANNEVGTLQPVAELAEAAHGRDPNTLVHTDAVQAVGKLPVDVKALGVDLLSLSGHKLYGPQGIGALYVRSGLRLTPQRFGGKQERGLTPGTENVAAIVGLGKACELAGARLDESQRALRELRDSFETALRERIAGTRINGASAERISNTSNVSFSVSGEPLSGEMPTLDGEMLAINLDLLEVAVSTGSACSTADREPSHVLLAMGRSESEARGVLRFSFGKDNTVADVEQAVAHLEHAVSAMRSRPRRPSRGSR